MSSKQLYVSFYRGSIHNTPGATGVYTGGIGQAAPGIGPRAVSPGVLELGYSDAPVTFEPAPDGSGDLVNVAFPVHFTDAYAHGDGGQPILGFAVFDRLHEPDAPVFAAPLPTGVQMDRQGDGTVSVRAGQLVILASALVERAPAPTEPTDGGDYDPTPGKVA